ncbi:hypothetical protein ACFQMM_03305 [Saliphagus sp. GCM10025308]|uniref:Uncharacterized protein n=1 Tax=Natronosalvus rutilus TaxID=2953753 RepID=A0A9E7N8Z1_9EURY|nr:hypothetical protein [Natronosalvus rutilus]UTF52460.1 hypothetical protein NGM29_11735 [Natronosalvus rutilus]
MSTKTTTDSAQATEHLYRGLKVLRGSLLLSTVLIGIILFLVAVFLEVVNQSSVMLTEHDGVFAAMFGVFGISAVLAGGLSYLVIKLLQRQ